MRAGFCSKSAKRSRAAAMWQAARAGTLRLGFAENSCWRGVVPESFRRFRELQPDAELQLQPAASMEQIEAIRSGRLDVGFVNFMPTAESGRARRSRSGAMECRPESA